MLHRIPRGKGIQLVQQVTTTMVTTYCDIITMHGNLEDARAIAPIN